ncbi:MAG: M16 family metallopeptidase [Planctomycetota bacterium]
MKTTQVRTSERIDERVHEGVTDAGLRVRVIPKPGYLKSFAVLVADYGSIDTDFEPAGGGPAVHGPAGVAHFLEHKLFQTEDGDAFSLFARYGASANAYTSYTQTAYHFGTSTDFYPCLDLLLDFVSVPYFTPEAIEKERKVIAQEIRMYEDSPDAVGHLELLRALYRTHPIREDITGTVESIAAIDGDVLRRCHGTFYHPENMLLAVSGDLDPSEVFARVEANAARRGPTSAAPPARRLLAEEPPEVTATRVERQMAVSMPRVLIGSKERALGLGPELIRGHRETAFVLDLLFGRSSAFFEEHCSSGLIDDTFQAGFSVGRGGYAHLMLGGETPDPDGLVAAIDRTIEVARADGLPRDDFARLRDKAWGRFVRSFNSAQGVALGEADSALEHWDLFAYLDLLASITPEALESRLAGLLAPERRAVSIVRPL